MRLLIGIQARSGSTRLPRKAFELIGGKTMLDRVIEACKKAASQVQTRLDLNAKVAVLTPTGDPIAEEFKARCDIVEGSEFDVLSRYVLAAERYKADLIVRITGDCPLIPPFIINRIVTIAAEYRYDYLSNCFEDYRTTLDGADCEAFSHKLLAAAGKGAASASDREHVTTWMRRAPPVWAKLGCVVNHFDQSDTKLSVDTPEDLERVRTAFLAANDKYHRAVIALGQLSVHKI